MKRNIFTVFIAVAVIFPAAAASFDCSKATQSDEIAICASRELSDLDVEMSVKYHFLRGLFAMGVSGEMADAQSDWLTHRRLCRSDSICLKRAYEARIKAFDYQYNTIDKPIQ